jgi:hypothetical protein
MNGKEIYKIAEELKNIKKFNSQFEKLTYAQKVTFARLVKLGDSEELALATAISQRGQDNSLYEVAYYS